jgi:hypothetical protein
MVKILDYTFQDLKGEKVLKLLMSHLMASTLFGNVRTNSFKTFKMLI